MNQEEPKNETPEIKSGMDRRTWLALGGMTVAGFAAVPYLRNWFQPTANVFVARNQKYSGPLAKTIADGLLACGVQLENLRGKRVLLKPNLVEPSPERPHMTTNPAMVVAAAEVFTRYGAKVKVGEAPGHVRDTEMALIASGLGEALYDAKIEFADLNYEADQRLPMFAALFNEMVRDWAKFTCCKL